MKRTLTKHLIPSRRGVYEVTAHIDSILLQVGTQDNGNIAIWLEENVATKKKTVLLHVLHTGDKVRNDLSYVGTAICNDKHTYAAHVYGKDA